MYLVGAVADKARAAFGIAPTEEEEERIARGEIVTFLGGA